MTALAVCSILALAFLALPLVATAGAMRLWTPVGGSVGLRLGAGLLVLGMVAVGAILAAWWDPAASAVYAWGLAAASVVVIVVGRMWRWAVRAIPVGLVAAGALSTSIGLLGVLPAGATWFSHAAARFLPWALPEDDRIPSLLATWFAVPDDAPFLLGDWLPSDRPPLQSGVILLVREWLAPVAALSDGAVTAGDVDAAASIVSQLVWVPAAVALMAAIGFGMRATIAAAAFAAVTPVMILNTVYTWPKILAGAFAVASIAVLVDAIRRRETRSWALVLAAALAALGLLAHGGTAFVLPLVLGLAVVLLVRMSTWTSRVRASALAAVAAIVVYAPWIAFQRFVAPPGDRLMKWHLAGVVPIDGRGFVETLVDQYASLSADEFWATRFANLGRAFDPRIATGLDLWTTGAVDRRLTAEFYETPIALSFGVVPLVVLLAVLLVRSVRRRTIGATTAWTALLVGGAWVCVAVWAVLLYNTGAAVVHQGSHAWIIVFLVLPFAWLWEYRAAAAGVVAALQVLLTLVLLWTAPVEGKGEAFAPLVVVGLALSIGAVALAPGRRSERSVGWKAPD